MVKFPCWGCGWPSSLPVSAWHREVPMTTTFASTTAIPSTAVVPARPAFGDQERQALAGFLAGYAGLTREACALDLRQFTAWCARHSLRLFDVRRAGIECFGRDLEAAGRARATVTRRLCAIAGSTGTR